MNLEDMSYGILWKPNGKLMRVVRKHDSITFKEKYELDIPHKDVFHERPFLVKDPREARVVALQGTLPKKLYGVGGSPEVPLNYFNPNSLEVVAISFAPINKLPMSLEYPTIAELGDYIRLKSGSHGTLTHINNDWQSWICQSDDNSFLALPDDIEMVARNGEVTYNAPLPKAKEEPILKQGDIVKLVGGVTGEVKRRTADGKWICGGSRDRFIFICDLEVVASIERDGEVIYKKERDAS